MSNKSNSQDVEPVFMSLEEAEAIIYGQEFFNVRRSYIWAKRCGDIAVKEAERNLNLSSKIHSELKESLESKPKDQEKEVENLFLDIRRNSEINAAKIAAKSFYSRPSSPASLKKMSSMDDLRSLQASPVFGRRSNSLTPEPTAYIIDDDHYNTIQAYSGHAPNVRKPLSYLPLKPSPLYRSTNINLANQVQPGNKVFSKFLYPPSDPRKHIVEQKLDQSRQQNTFVQQTSAKGKLLGSNVPPYYSSYLDAFKRGRGINGHKSSSRRLGKQLTLPESWRLDQSIEEEGIGNTSPILTTSDSCHSTVSRIENEKPLHYYIIGRTNNT